MKDTDDIGLWVSWAVFLRFDIDGWFGRPPGAGGTRRPGAAGAAPEGGLGAPNVGGLGADDLLFVSGSDKYDDSWTAVAWSIQRPHKL